MSIVSNTGLLVALAKADMLVLPRSLFGEVLVATAVHRETLAGVRAEADRLDAAFADYIRASQVGTLPPKVEHATANLGAGEQQAIALALQEDLALIIDDKLGRRVASSLGVSVTGTAGVLIGAKRAGRIPFVRPIPQAIRDNGYYLPEDLIEIAAKLAGE